MMPKGKRISINREVLYHKYVVENKSTRQIASELGVTKTCILRHMNIYDIQRRDSPTVISRKYGSTSYKEIQAFYMTRIRKHALELKVAYSITAEQIYLLFYQQNCKCVLSGIELKLGDTASLDRIDGKKGYTIDNIQWIHKTLQKMKQNMSNQDFITWCKLIGRYHESK